MCVLKHASWHIQTSKAHAGFVIFSINYLTGANISKPNQSDRLQTWPSSALDE
jgi:hypothetical protein